MHPASAAGEPLVSCDSPSRDDIAPGVKLKLPGGLAIGGDIGLVAANTAT